LIFNCSIGDLFVIRTAGHTVDAIVRETIEYAILQLHTPQLIVMGHEECGAIISAADAYTKMNPDSDNGEIINTLQPVITAVYQSEKNYDTLIHDAVIENIKYTIRHITNSSSVIQTAAADNSLSIQGALYSLKSGCVEIIPV